ncbi:MAG: hypothetical protein QG671_2518 [Actinomycetota bacterium]|nr:hypothetical protein [Actinomycetota bacterium]
MTGTDWDAYVDRYHAGHPGITERALHHARHPVHGTAYEWLAAALPDPAGDVVDLACGSAPLQPHINHATYLGIDRSESELSAARSAGRGPVRSGDVTDLHLPDDSADTIVMSMALMLVPLSKTLTQVARVLRPGGTFAAIVPAAGPVLARDLPALIALSAALRGPGSMPRMLTAKSLHRQLNQAGLTPHTAGRQRFPFPVSSQRDAQLAVTSLYTPGRTARQLRRAETWLRAMPGGTELPVPLLRITARRP